MILAVYILTCSPLVSCVRRIECMAVNEPGNILVCGSRNGTISMRTLWDLEEKHRIDVSIHGAIKYLRFTDGAL